MLLRPDGNIREGRFILPGNFRGFQPVMEVKAWMEDWWIDGWAGVGWSQWTGRCLNGLDARKDGNEGQRGGRREGRGGVGDDNCLTGSGFSQQSLFLLDTESDISVPWERYWHDPSQHHFWAKLLKYGVYNGLKDVLLYPGSAWPCPLIILTLGINGGWVRSVLRVLQSQL